MRRLPSLVVALLAPASLLGGCTGLVAGPEVAASTPVPASRDSAYTRARRGLTGELFTMDVVDSSQGHLTGTRYPSSSAQLGTSARCLVRVDLNVAGDASASNISTTTRWLAPEQMVDKAPQVCEQERKDVLERVNLVLVPPPPTQ
jgi:hypothetical protein